MSFNAATFFVDRHVAEGRGARPALRHAGRTIICAEVAEAHRRAQGMSPTYDQRARKPRTVTAAV